MKSIATPLLVLSLIINMMFGFNCYQGSKQTVEPLQASPSDHGTQHQSEEPTTADASQATSSPRTPFMTFDWHQVESDDYRA